MTDQVKKTLPCRKCIEAGEGLFSDQPKSEDYLDPNLPDPDNYLLDEEFDLEDTPTL